MGAMNQDPFRFRAKAASKTVHFPSHLAYTLTYPGRIICVCGCPSVDEPAILEYATCCSYGRQMLLDFATHRCDMSTQSGLTPCFRFEMPEATSTQRQNVHEFCFVQHFDVQVVILAEYRQTLVSRGVVSEVMRSSDAPKDEEKATRVGSLMFVVLWASTFGVHRTMNLDDGPSNPVGDPLTRTGDMVGDQARPGLISRTTLALLDEGCREPVGKHSANAKTKQRQPL